MNGYASGKIWPRWWPCRRTGWAGAWGVRSPAPQLAAKIADQVDADFPVGAILHHAVMDDYEQSPIDHLLELVALQAASTTTIFDLASDGAAASTTGQLMRLSRSGKALR